MLFKIGNLNRIDWIYGILYFAFNAPFMFPKKRPSLIIKPEGINKKLVCFPDLILGRLIIQDSACLYGDFAADKGNQLCFTGYPLGQYGISSSDTIRLMGITASDSGLLIFDRQLSGAFI